MSHFCHRCSATLPDDVPFCSQCGAPQIRVVTESPRIEEPQDQGQSLTATAVPEGVSRSADWKLGFSAAIKAGAVMAVVATVPTLIFFCFVWLPLGGALSVVLYLRRLGARVLLSPGLGARLGALAGLLGFVIYAVMQAAYMSLMRFALHQKDVLREMFFQAIDQAARRNPDPAAQSLLASFKTPEGIAALVAISLAMIFLAFVVFGSLGGVLATRVLGNRRNPRL